MRKLRSPLETNSCNVAAPDWKLKPGFLLPSYIAWGQIFIHIRSFKIFTRCHVLMM